MSQDGWTHCHPPHICFKKKRIYIKTWSHTAIIIRNMIFFRRHKNWFASCEWGILTCAEGVNVLVELEPHHWTIAVNDVGLAIPGARNHLLAAVSLQTNTGKFETRILLITFQNGISSINKEIIHSACKNMFILLDSTPAALYSLRYSLGYCDQ